MRLIIPGIYIIRCLPTGDVYVGGAQNIRNRWHGHRGALRAGQHPSKRMQEIYNVYGMDALEFTIVEVSYALHDLSRLEYTWIQRLGATLNAPGRRPGAYPVNWHFGHTPLSSEAERLVSQYAKCGGDSEAYVRYLHRPSEHPLPQRPYVRAWIEGKGGTDGES